MVSIEPRWSVSNFQLLYADGLVSKRLLINLGIQNSCLLHGDYYHLFRENWPNEKNFGTTIFRLIKCSLSAMLLSETEEDWVRTFESAASLLIGHPHKLELLQKIYNNPGYYGGYVTRRIIGNLSLNGSTPTEQNHSSIVAFNGEVMLGTIIAHVKSLLERQQQLSNKENDFESDYM